jgi:copper chaperone CopZ
VATHVFHVSGMYGRGCVRAISARVSDVPGVRTVEASVETGTVRVTGTAEPAAVAAAIRLAGYDAR